MIGIAIENYDVKIESVIFAIHIDRRHHLLGLAFVIVRLDLFFPERVAFFFLKRFFLTFVLLSYISSHNCF